MLQNSTVAAFTIFELIRENQLGGKITPLPTPPATQIKVKGELHCLWGCFRKQTGRKDV